MKIIIKQLDSYSDEKKEVVLSDEGQSGDDEIYIGVILKGEEVGATVDLRDLLPALIAFDHKRSRLLQEENSE